MTIKTEQNLRYFEFWSGAKSNAEMMTCEELDSVENELEALYPEGMTDTEINDLLGLILTMFATSSGLNTTPKKMR